MAPIVTVILLKRVNVYLPDNLYLELKYWTDQYNVSHGYVLQLAYKLVDRKKLEQLLELKD